MAHPHINITFSVTLQPGFYSGIDERLEQLLDETASYLTGEQNSIVASVDLQEWELHISPDNH